MTQDKTHQNAMERLDSLANRAEMGGGPKAIERHHKKGKLTARTAGSAIRWRQLC